MLKKAWIGLSIALLLATSISAQAKLKKKSLPTQQPRTSETKTNTVIAGKQYIVLVSGARPNVDNAIYYVPCNADDCYAILEKVKEQLPKYYNRYSNYNNKKKYYMTTGYSDCITKIGNYDMTACGEEEKTNIASLGATPVKPEEYLDQVFQSLSKKLNITRTDFNGNYNINCPTSKCLIFGRP